MLCCFGEIGVFIVGIVLLVRGTINLTPSRVVRGAPARVIGVLLMLPLVLGQGSEAVYGFAIGAQRGFERAKQGKQFGPEDAAELKKNVVGPAIAINVVGTMLPLLVALGIAVAKAEPRDDRRRRHRRPDDEDEDEFDRPRRRRRRYDDEEEDEEEDDVPRKRRRRYDDEDDRDRGDEHIKSRD
jgi:hypothetical protein